MTTLWVCAQHQLWKIIAICVRDLPTSACDLFPGGGDFRSPGRLFSPTVVKSLAMIPVRSADPIAAIDMCWARIVAVKWTLHDWRLPG